MKAWGYAIGDVLLIRRKNQEVPARIAGFQDQLDNTTPLLCNLRVSDGQRWSVSQYKVFPSQIVKLLPYWEEERKAQWEAELKQHTAEIWAKMSNADKRKVHREAVELGFAQEPRSPLDILIDRAVGRE